MTSSQEPPLTRREMRERERLLEQQAASSTPGAAPAPASQQGQPAQQQVPTQAPQPVPAPPQPQPTDYTAPRPAGGFSDPSSPFGGAVVTPSGAPESAFPVRFDPTASAPPRQEPVPEPSTPERTLTRRELRAMLDAHAAGEFHDLDVFDELETEAPAAPAPSAAAPVTAAPMPGATSNPFGQPPAPTRAAAPHQVADAAIADEPAAAPKPVGHWTSQLDAPVERAEPFDQLLSRGGVSHGIPTTTNALILPSLPDQGPMSDALAKSGEVIVTGSIDLPRSFGATGVHPSQIDSSDVDRLFDQVEDGAGVGAPVAATRAISTQNGARAMMAPPKKEGMNVPLVLAVTAGVLALGVVATLIIGAVAGLF
jgi:hypothetical protein